MAYAKRKSCQICGAVCINKFCSKKCSGISRTTRVWRTCERCSKRFTAKPSDIKSRGARFCSSDCWNKTQAQPLTPRFWSKVQKSRACWNWSGTLDKDGYGVIQGENRRQVRAQRLSYELNIGPIPSGKHVLHRCDNRACVNPKHLFLGTNLENIADKVKKQRQSAKLTPEKVRRIKRMLKSSISVSSIAVQMGVTIGAIYPIAKGKTWKYITP
jgi:hypothetical protein